ncbi:MAG: hypothetical protein DWP97_02000 [Calditrichaeota bacterium]|nr:MAG: hypothetical protein DWP97_02000 [Calditrichota bacterium]
MKIDFNKKLLLALILVYSVLNQACMAEDLSSTFTRNVMAIDGKLDDWKGIGAYFDKDKEVSLAVCNDSEYLYIKMHTQSQDNVRTIKMTGLKIYIDNGDGDKKDFYIKYNAGPETKLSEKGDIDEKRRPTSPENQFLCFDKKRMLNKIIPTDGSEGPAAAFDEEKQVFVYEFKIPLHKSTTNSYGIEINPEKKFKIGFVWGDKDDIPKGMKPPGGGKGGFGGNDSFNPPTGGRGMGGRGGGRQPGGKRPGQFQIEKKEIWIKSILASDSTMRQED